ncbi:MAG: HIT domain-containing protein [Candidatus Lambdaproteobacteria bacterium]|nr:HIT domain-containing protein [Candidatus Lambdaproteobacteria bacterium]
MASLFTRIIRGELPAVKVYETQTEIALLDINPMSDGHTLVLPKLEVARYDDLPVEVSLSLTGALRRVVKGVCLAMGTRDYNLILNNGGPAGQVIFHVHFHIVPRYEGQPRRDRRWNVALDRLEPIGQRIRQALAQLPQE